MYMYEVLNEHLLVYIYMYMYVCICFTLICSKVHVVMLTGYVTNICCLTSYSFSLFYYYMPWVLFGGISCVLLFGVVERRERERHTCRTGWREI